MISDWFAWFLPLAAPEERAAGLVLLFVASVATLHAAAGLAARQRWYVAVLAFVAYALAGFLLNPLADANPPRELLRWLGSPRGTATASLLQLLLGAASLALASYRSAGGAGRWAVFGLGVVQAAPAVPVVLLMLLAEQWRLAESLGKRPETVGWEVGLAAGSLVVGGVLLARTLPRRWLRELELWLGIGLLLACMIVPVLPAELPRPVWKDDVSGLGAVTLVLAGAAALAGLGWYWESVTTWLLRFGRLAARNVVAAFARTRV